MQSEEDYLDRPWLSMYLLFRLLLNLINLNLFIIFKKSLKQIRKIKIH